MSREIPEVVRAAAGLAATVLDEARKLPQTLPGLPVRFLGLAMQQAMKVQQQYAGLVARGDELFTGLRGENEPGLATFDDDEPITAPSNGFRGSAFDRAGDTYAVGEPADQVERGRRSIEEFADEAPSTHEIRDEIAIDEHIDQAPTLEETAPTLSVVEDAPATEDADAVETALLESDESPAATDSPVETEPSADVSTTVDVPTPDTRPATVTDESGSDVAATGVRTDAGGSDTSEEDRAIAAGAAIDAIGEVPATPTDDPEGGSELSGSQAAGAAPVDGYDSFSIAQLRGRLRGYALSTVQDLLAYEEATRAREPYLRMLRNRLEKLEEQAIASSPLTPRGN
jgi:hypothetical protein